ncbi:hypothetical protein DW013_21070 [Phocaeicola vulgatus]|nr:hypothetical protein DW013_21070 [Phocaeicola vulgatus]
MPKPASTRSAYKMLTCIYLCRTLLFFAPYADFFGNKSDKTPNVERFLNDLKKDFFPYIIPFVKQYTKIIDFYSNSGHIQHIYADKQFSLGVICSLLCNHEEFIEETLVPLAKASEGGWIFREFFKCTNYVTDIVEPIKKYVAENNIHFEQ